jgi:hypothetical protein
MSKITNRNAAPRDGASVEDLLARLLDTPFLARVVPHLRPETLYQLIRFHGLDACGELVTSATAAQLTSVLDLDLWRHTRPGRNEEFDVDRFGEWLEVLVDAGSSVAARTITALDKDLVILGLSRYVRVFDPGIFEPTAQSDDEPTLRDEAMHEGDSIDEAPMDDASGGLECDVAGYIVRARRADAWDAIVTLLVALDAEQGQYFHAVMQGCRNLSNSRPEIDGLDELLLPAEQHLHDVAIERERRRSRQGYATPAEARAFLEMARRPNRTQSGTSATGSAQANPTVAAYFRAIDEVADPSDESGMIRKRPRALLAAADTDAQARLHTKRYAEISPEPWLRGAVRLTRVRRLMACVRDTDEAAYLRRSRELAFLANTLMAGCSVQARPFTPREAFDAAAGICNLGLDYWPGRWPPLTSSASSLDGPQPHDTCPPDSWLIDHDLVTAFEVGWSVLYQDVSLFVAEQLVSMLTELHCADRDVRRGLVALQRTLVTERDAGTPWRARDAAEVLAMLDMTAGISVLGLLGECPVLPAALRAVVDGRTTRVSATAFDFISTAAQIGDVRIFMRKLPAVLSQF